MMCVLCCGACRVCACVLYDMCVCVTLQSVELMECTGEEFLPWVAQYLVMKRASIEHNFHTLYSNFIDHLKKPEFLTVVIAETYRNIKVPVVTYCCSSDLFICYSADV